MATVTPVVASMPAAPDPNDRATFNARAYPWSVALDTFADEVQAVADAGYVNAVETAASAVTATDKAALTAADRVQTGLDRAQTAADRVQTGLDVAATAAWSASLVPGIAGVASVNGLGGVITIPITHFLTMQAGII